MKILTVVGARPQFIKAAAVSRSLIKFRKDIGEVIVHTGQHYDANMSDVFFDELSIPKPMHNLGVGGGTHGQNTGRMLEAIEKVLINENPDCVMVYGDTDSTLAGALAAAKLHIPVAHVEAGLRSYNRVMPEEMNRVLTDHLSSKLFVPGKAAENNLSKEGISGDNVIVVGDVMYDVALYYSEYAKRPLCVESIGNDRYVLGTIHRAENTDSLARLSSIFEALGTIDCKVVVPLHPRTASRLRSESSIKVPSNLLVIPPVGYLEMVWLEANCEFVVTDSGGVQKEAFFHKKPCVTIRDETEWVELVDLGVNYIAGTSAFTISAAIEKAKKTVVQSADVYGTGNASELIALSF
jgi:UDP-GlcNAc3NAcA epimerase